MIRRTLIHKTDNATLRFTKGDDYVYLDFVDRTVSIYYKKTSQTGKKLIKRIKKLGYEKVTYSA